MHDPNDPSGVTAGGVQPSSRVLVARQIGRQGLRCLFHAIDMANHDNGAWRVRSHMLADRAQQHAGRGSAPSSPAMPLSKFQATQNRDGGLLTHSVKTLPGSLPTAETSSLGNTRPH